MADTFENHFPSEETLRRIAAALEETASNQRTSKILSVDATALATAKAAWDDIIATDPAVSHRNIYRGKSLGTELTSTQKSKIADGSFEDMYIGDYWIINSRVYRIADINYYYNCGDTAFTKNHLVIVPDASFGNGKMNSTNVTTNGYTNSLMYTDTETPSVLNSARTTIANDFGAALASHKIYIPTTTNSSGLQTSGSWVSSTVDLMNECMVYGTYHNRIANPGSTFNYSGITVEKSQLALFRLNPALIRMSYWWWLRDVASGTYFALVHRLGNADYYDASYSLGVRPAFCIVGN